MIRDQIIKALQKATREKEVHLEFPENEAHGDYSTNIVMQKYGKHEERFKGKYKRALGKATFRGESPTKYAEETVKKLKKDGELMKNVEDIKVAGPGFINFWISEKTLTSELQKVIKEGDKYGSSNLGKGKKIIVEYSSPNIAKYFGIGHLRSTIIGQALYNLYEALGYEVVGDNHIGDWGTQFGMIIAQVEKKNLEVSKLSVGDFEKLYIEFNKRLQKEPKLREVAKDAFKRLESGDKTAQEIWKEAKRTSQDEFERIYKRLGVKIDNAYGESFYKDKMQDVIDELRKKGLTKKSKGAEIVEFTPPAGGLPPAMLLKSDGATTYYTRDLATVKFRMGKFKPDIVIYEVGSEQTLHFKQVFKTAEKIGWLNSTKLVHVPHGLIRYTHGKMASRKGETIKLEDVLDEAVQRAEEIIDKSATSRGLSKKDKGEVAEKVGIGAIKYFDLSHHPTSDIIFEWEKMFVLEGNSAPYLQYTYARTQSLLRKAKVKDSGFRIQDSRMNDEELAVIRNLHKFPEVIGQAAQNYSPNLLCNYLFDLAQRYNNLYNQHRIIGSKNQELRIMLTTAVGQILKNGLTLLGIQAPRKM